LGGGGLRWGRVLSSPPPSSGRGRTKKREGGKLEDYRQRRE